jgi:hypothetical protein
MMILGLGVAALVVVTMNEVVGVVPRRRVEGFARLHSLPVTAANGNQIIAYRATTRRWRAVGFALGVLVPLTVTGQFSITFVWALTGWFAGAAVAELRVAHLASGPRASASLTPRRACDYLPRAGRWAVPAAMALCALTGLYCAADHAAHPAGSLEAVTLWAVLGLGLGAVALAAQRHVLRRPQPIAGPDQVAADDAIRSRSMHVLAAAGMVLVGNCVGGQFVADDMLPHNHAAGAFNALFGLGFPITGLVLAYWPSARRGPSPTDPGPSVPSAPEPA